MRGKVGERPFGEEPATSPSVTHSDDAATDSTREQILRAAAHRFARDAYSQVSIDDILLDAKLTKTAMYRHFESKRALAVALIERRVLHAAILLEELTNRDGSGMETLVDITFTLAVQDLTDDYARGGYLLLESIGRIEGLRMSLADAYAMQLAPVVQRAIDEGDLRDTTEADQISRLLITLYTGLLAVLDLDKQQDFMSAVEKTWGYSLSAFANPERVDYLSALVRRRTAVALRRLESGASGASG